MKPVITTSKTISSLHFVETTDVLNQLIKELNDIQTYPSGKPIKYYHAYQFYSTQYNIDILEKLAIGNQGIERKAILKTLSLYKNFNLLLTKTIK